MFGIRIGRLNRGHGIGRKGFDDGLVDRLLGRVGGVRRRVGVPRISVEEKKGGVEKAVGIFALCSVSLTLGGFYE